MWYIKNAQFVFTDSFHGEVFSIKFNKDFYVYYVEENRASRIIDLSHLFHVEDRMITNVEDINGSFKKQIDRDDFKKAEEASLSYLKEIKRISQNKKTVRCQRGPHGLTILLIIETSLLFS